MLVLFENTTMSLNLIHDAVSVSKHRFRQTETTERWTMDSWRPLNHVMKCFVNSHNIMAATLCVVGHQASTKSFAFLQGTTYF